IQVDYRTADLALVREINLAIILNYLRANSPLSRAQLAAMTGLNKTTVSSLVSELIEGRYVREAGQNHVGSGRPAVLLELNPDAGCIIGVEIRLDYVTVILTDFTARVLRRYQQPIHGVNQEESIATALDMTQTLWQACPSGVPILGIGVAIPGLMDEKQGVVLFAPNLKWHDVPLRDIFTRRFPARVVVDNDANAAAVGERYLGAAREVDSFIYLMVGEGVGAGIFMGGRLARGVGGYAGEVGHMTMVPDGEPCNCGNRGCWETLTNTKALLRRVHRAISAGQSTLALEMAGGDVEQITLTHVMQAAQQGDTVALTALEETGEYLGIGIANLLNAFNPSLVLLGGPLGMAGEFLLPAIERTVEQRALEWPRQSARV
ncbi:MAG TPA: ROK family transcriptional regulator, partial [Anaerolineae bacterium]|nr:ROK family transcriptional regulator [Anaerolineae bacterium]